MSCEVTRACVSIKEGGCEGGSVSCENTRESSAGTAGGGKNETYGAACRVRSSRGACDGGIENVVVGANDTGTGADRHATRGCGSMLRVVLSSPAAPKIVALSSSTWKCDCAVSSAAAVAAAAALFGAKKFLMSRCLASASFLEPLLSALCLSLPTTDGKSLVGTEIHKIKC